jgi:hypothetical protein
MKLVRIENARQNVPEPEYIKVDVDVDAYTPLTYDFNTKTIVASEYESHKTEYVSMAACKAGELCPVVKLDSHQVWELPLSDGEMLNLPYSDIEPGTHVNTSGKIVIGNGNEAIIVAVPEEPKAGSLVHIRYFCYPSQK